MATDTRATIEVFWKRCFYSFRARGGCNEDNWSENSSFERELPFREDLKNRNY
jgi:hypothetical protein